MKLSPLATMFARFVNVSITKSINTGTHSTKATKIAAATSRTAATKMPMLSAFVRALASSVMIWTKAGRITGRTTLSWLAISPTSSISPFTNRVMLSPLASHVTRSVIKVKRLEIINGVESSKILKTLCRPVVITGIS